MSDKKNLSLEEREQLAEAVRMKKSKKEYKDKVCGENAMEKSYREIGHHRKW